MAQLRLIARLDIKGPNLIKSIQLEGVRKLGDPWEFARRYYESGIDEILYLDAVASLYERDMLTKIVKRTAEEVFIPMTVGGGIRSVDDVREMLRAGAELLADAEVVVPVPLHWLRRIKRRYNQSALLGRALAREIGLTFCADMLERPRATPPLDGMSPAKRHETLEQALSINGRRQGDLQGRPVLLIDDVMTSGATLSAATGVLQEAGSGPVSVLTLARAVKDA